MSGSGVRRMRFYKMHGLGNDFIFVQATEGELDGLRAKSEPMCDRNFGIGADGLIVMVASKVADFRMVIYNSDGSEAEMCGNAIRCAAVLWTQMHPGTKEPVAVETLKGVQYARITQRTGRDWNVEVDMGEPATAASAIPVIANGDTVIDEPFDALGETLKFTCVNMGNPHAVAFVEKSTRDLMMRLGPHIESHPRFPRKTNVEFCEMMPDGSIKVFVWERGAGPTLACGSGACAVAVAANLTGRAGRKCRVALPGGELDIHWREDNHVMMSGPASFVFKGELTDKYIG